MMIMEVKGMLSFIIGLGAIVGVVGWFITKSLIFIGIGILCYLVETIMEWKNLNANAKLVDVFIFVIGCIVGLFIKSMPFWLCGIVALLIYSALLGIGGVISIFSMFKK